MGRAGVRAQCGAGSGGSAQATSQYRYDTATSDANPTSAGVDYILIETTGTVIKWTLNIKTVLNEDTGY